MATEYISEIHQLLKLGEPVEVRINGAPEGLPIQDADSHGHIVDQGKPAEAVELEKKFINSLEAIGRKSASWQGLLVYPMIFIAAFAFFYVVLNFSSFVAQIQGFFIKPQAQVALGDNTTAYYKWIESYYYAVNDPKLLDPNNDIDKDGLSNYDEFVMGTNPIINDSDSDGFSDGVEVINNHNSWGSGLMTLTQKTLAGGLDLNLINNRISYNAAVNRGIVSGTSKFNYDLNKPGVLSIPRLNLQVPLVWSKDPSTFEADLSTGVIHYPGTAMPGERGTIYVSGHSSDYIWKNNPMQAIFARLNYLQPGDDVFIAVYGLDGKTYNYRYQVTGQKIYAPADQGQFIDDSANKLNLSTCWPIGTSTNRIVVSAVQVGL